jgi:hypothetical protein
MQSIIEGKDEILEAAISYIKELWYKSFQIKLKWVSGFYIIIIRR